jgi:maltose alpha-D-glucosyltransferase/alpha-amylase
MYLAAAATLGKRTAELHLALASASDDPAFAPEPMTAFDRNQISSELREHAVRVFDQLKENLASLPDEIVDQAGLMLSHRRQVLERLRKIEDTNDGTMKIRIHGDYHLGQVLVVDNDYFILDFEGEPARSLAERRAKRPALKDVAGMLRSYSYAAYGGLLNYTARRSAEYEKLEPWAELWERWVCSIFLSGYCTTAAGAPFLPVDPSQFRQLLDVFLLDKALYELRYEMNNRPGWVRIPLRGMLSLLQQP